VKKIVQKSEIECLEGMMGAENTNRMCCGGGQLACVVCCCFRQTLLTQLSIKIGCLAYINILSNLSNPVLLSFNNAVLFCFNI